MYIMGQEIRVGMTSDEKWIKMYLCIYVLYYHGENNELYKDETVVGN